MKESWIIKYLGKREAKAETWGAGFIRRRHQGIGTSVGGRGQRSMLPLVIIAWQHIWPSKPHLRVTETGNPSLHFQIHQLCPLQRSDKLKISDQSKYQLMMVFMHIKTLGNLLVMLFCLYDIGYQAIVELVSPVFYLLTCLSIWMTTARD